MTTAAGASRDRDPTADAPHRAGRLGVPNAMNRVGAPLAEAAFILLLACVAARCFLGEMPFRVSPLRFELARLAARAEGAVIPAEPSHAPGRGELSRMVFAGALLLAAGLWLADCAARRRLEVHRTWLVVLILTFAAWSFVSMLRASDQRAARNAWLEQVSFLSACFLCVQLCRQRRRFGMLVVVLAGVGATLAVKGLWQYFVEAPDRVADFEANKAVRLAQFGWAEGTAQARLLEARVRDRAPFGYFSLANVFGSLLIVLLSAAAAVAAEKLTRAIRSYSQWKRGKAPGEVPLGVVAGVLSAAAAGVLAVVLVLTGSAGAILSAAVGVVAAVVILLWRRRLARHWRKCLLALGAMAVLGVAGVAAYGLANDRLPGKTMTFRWYYWSASGEIARDCPLLGAGPGNFPAAYLLHRRPQAEEAVKIPHNALVHAVVQYGLVGGALYAAIAVCVLLGSARPEAVSIPRPQQVTAVNVRAVTPLLLVVFAAVAARMFLGQAAQDPAMLVLECVMPAVLLAVMLALAAWWGDGLGVSWLDGGAVRVALGCGLAAFVLHNMVTFSLSMPATTLVLWAGAGACLARAPGGRTRALGALARPVAIVATVGLIVLAVAFCGPVVRRTLFSEQMVESLGVGDTAGAIRYARRAAESDKADALAARDAARLLLATCADDPRRTADALAQARQWANEAIRRDPGAYRNHATLADVHAALATLGEPGAVRRRAESLSRAVRLDPMNFRLRIDYAEAALDAGLADECLRQLDKAEHVESKLIKPSVEEFTPAERERISAIRARARALSGEAGKG